LLSTLGAIYVVSESVHGTIADARYYDGMVLNLNKAEQYRREAENCLDRAEIAPDELTKRRMRKLAAQWLQKAAKSAVRKKLTSRQLKSLER